MSKIKEFVVPTVVLFVICLVAAALLGLTNEITKGKIEENDSQAQAEAQQAVLPDAEEFSESVTNDYGTYAVAKDKDGKVIGYAVTATGKGGYDGEIKVMVGLDADGKVASLENGEAAVQILDNSETPSVGGKVLKSVEFFKQFIGLEKSAALTKDGGKVDAVSGATKTSTGVTNAVNNALLCYENIKEVA